MCLSKVLVMSKDDNLVDVSREDNYVIEVNQ